jgi:hypothetical protein
MIAGGKTQPCSLEVFQRMIRREIRLVDRAAADCISHSRDALLATDGVVVYGAGRHLELTGISS